MTETPKIVTSFCGMGWTATREDFDLGDPCGTGLTEEKAKADLLEMEEARTESDWVPDDPCICTAPFAGPTDIDPPEVRRDRACPIHGDMAHNDPDRARDEQQDREAEE